MFQSPDFIFLPYSQGQTTRTLRWSYQHWLPFNWKLVHLFRIPSCLDLLPLVRAKQVWEITTQRVRFLTCGDDEKLLQLQYPRSNVTSL
jgi:hypothetical protein